MHLSYILLEVGRTSAVERRRSRYGRRPLTGQFRIYPFCWSWHRLRPDLFYKSSKIRLRPDFPKANPVRISQKQIRYSPSRNSWR